MKKYLQYNASQYLKQQQQQQQAASPEVGAPRPASRAPEVRRGSNDCRGEVLDLSGRPGVPPQASVAMVTGQKWKEEVMQDAALDLSRGNLLNNSDQSEALDLSKPSCVRAQHAPSPRPSVQSPSVRLPHHGLRSPPTSNHSKPMIGQYSLLQAALNSAPPNAAVTQGFEKMAQLEAELRARMIAGGMAIADPSRTIKPFSTVPSRPVGISVPHLAVPNSSIAVVQGIHKPVAITTPQPHQSLATAKSQSVTQGTINLNNTSQSMNSLPNPPLSVSQSEYISRYHGQLNQSTSPKGIMGMHAGYINRGEMKRDQFVIRTPDSTSTIMNNQNYVKMENLHGYACAQCPKMFKNKAALKLHTTVHKTSEERQYECQVCKRRFLHRHHLVVHQRKHSGEKPFKCNACSKTFMAIFLLHKHLRKHVRENSMNSVISTEQLQQLHVRKMTSDGPAGTHGIVGNVTNPVVINGSPATGMAKDESNSNMTKEKVNNIINDAVAPVLSESKQDIDTVITISSDELNSSTSTLSISNSSALKDLKYLPKHTVEYKPDVLIEAIKAEVQESKEVVLDNATKEVPTTSGASKTVDTVSDSVNTFHQNITPDTHSVNNNNTESKADSEVTKEPEVRNVGQIQESDKQPEEPVNPFPVFDSDDEVELDFVTGELKLVDKDKNQDASESVTLPQEHSPEISTEANTDNVSEVSELPVAEKDKDIATTVDQTHDTEIENKDTYEKECREEKETVADGLAINNTEAGKLTDKSSIDHETESTNIVEQTVGETYYNETDIVKVTSQECDKDRKRKSSGEVDEPVAKRLSLDTETGDTKDIEMTDTVKNNVAMESIENQTPNTTAETSKLKRSKKGRKAKCELCHRTFHSQHHLLLHMVVHKKNPMLISLKKAKANQMKVLGYNGKSSVNCEICKKVFKFQKSLNSHMRVHSEKLKQNKLLSKAFRDFMTEAVPPSQKSHHAAPDSESHDSTAPAEKTTTDSEQDIKKETLDSGISVSNASAVLKKIEPDIDPPIKVIIGKDQIKRFLCHACNNTYTTKQKLKMHALIHKDNCFLCDICGKSFFREVTLDKHIATHMLPRPYVCPMCKKSFIHRSSLMRHKVVHEKSAMPSLKQQVADVNFELKMLDTYTMLRQERMQKIEMEKMKELEIEPEYLENKVSVLDLSVKVKMEDSSLPPVLSPAISQSSIPPQSSNDLSPPLITKEACINKAADQFEPLKTIKSDPGVSQDDSVVETGKGKKGSGEKRRRTISNEGQGGSSSDSNTFLKTARKTRVYETSCRVCREKFPNVMGLKTHMSVHNTVETHLYECHICQHRFTQSCSLLRHLKTSCQENRMTCLPCGKTFHRRNTYDQHMKLHQVAPPSLDGSFYDKRKDEAEVKEEVERESDIENNNTKAAAVASIEVPLPQIQPVEIPQVKTEPFPITKFIPSELNMNENSSDSTDSDERTYLYSEGEVHIGHMSDFSDSDISPPQSPKPDISRSILPSNASPNTMTLNLLSAVCSDIRNAEREEEERRKEMEERQKELETIEILANLKRGAMQNSLHAENSRKQEMKCLIRSPPYPVNIEPPPNHVVDLSQVKHNTAETEERKHVRSIHHMIEEHLKDKIKVEPPDIVSSESDDCRIVHQSFSRDVKVIAAPKEPNPTIPTIPTVVLEVTAEAEKLKKQKVERIKQNQPIQFQTGKDNQPILDEKTQNILKELSRMNVYNSIIQDRLSLLMKAQPSSSQMSSSSSNSSSLSLSLPSVSSLSSSTSLVSMTTSPHLVTSTSPKVYPSPSHTFSNDPQNNPQDLTVKKPTTPVEGKDLKTKLVPQVTEGVSRSRSQTSTPTTPAPPPLVPVFRCELCGRVMYNNSELCIHMREHNISPESFRKKPPFVAISDPRRNLSMLTKPRTPEESSSCVSSSTLTDKTATTDPVMVTPPAKKVMPPLTLDLSLKPSPTTSKLFTATTPTLSSPLTGSDFSDSMSSPTTPSSAAGNLDHLRIELRNKIYARRRSQGLEELTVEFKSPEPTEMTEEEKKKLDYRRECNRQAAQRSRMRKKDLVDSLLEELHKEEIVNSDLRRKMECLSAEKIYLLKVLDSHTCVNNKLDSESK